MIFSDIHFHGLYGVDDGAHSREHMLAMIDAEYEDGVRFLCFTPHFNPLIWGRNEEHIKTAFAEAEQYAAEKYADMKLILGNELRYSPGCMNWVRERRCSSMGDSRYILIDFDYDEDAETIMSGLTQIFNTGYKPVLAHAERYVRFHRDLREVRRLSELGVIIQLDTQSITGEFGFSCKSRAKKILSSGLADLISSDAHGLHTRPTGISKVYQIVCRKYGRNYADELCGTNALYYFGGK